MEQTKPPYDYGAAGFNDFLIRSIDAGISGAQAAPVRQLNFDQNQVSGSLGDTLQIGSILLDGKAGSIVIYDDGGVPVAILGELG